MFETGCCGADFNTDRTTFLGLLTLAVPLLAVSSIVLLLLLPMYVFGAKGRTLVSRLTVIPKSILTLIQGNPLAPRLRCKLSGAFFSASPRFSGFVYRYFNLAFLLIIWLSFVLIAASIIWWPVWL